MDDRRVGRGCPRGRCGCRAHAATRACRPPNSQYPPHTSGDEIAAEFDDALFPLVGGDEFRQNGPGRDRLAAQLGIGLDLGPGAQGQGNAGHASRTARTVAAHASPSSVGVELRSRGWRWTTRAPAATAARAAAATTVGVEGMTGSERWPLTATSRRALRVAIRDQYPPAVTLGGVTFRVQGPYRAPLTAM